jgi:hypothetical protein
MSNEQTKVGRYTCGACGRRHPNGWHCQKYVNTLAVDPRRRAPVVGEMYLRRSTSIDERPRWVLSIADAYQTGRTWIEYSERAGVTNEKEVGRERIELHAWEEWVRNGGELIGWRDLGGGQ